MGAKNGMETGHLKIHIEVGRLSVLQEMASREMRARITSSNDTILHSPVRNIVRKWLTAPPCLPAGRFEVRPGHTAVKNDPLMNNR